MAKDRQQELAEKYGVADTAAPTGPSGGDRQAELAAKYGVDGRDVTSASPTVSADSYDGPQFVSAGDEPRPVPTEEQSGAMQQLSDQRAFQGLTKEERALSGATGALKNTLGGKLIASVPGFGEGMKPTAAERGADFGTAGNLAKGALEIAIDPIANKVFGMVGNRLSGFGSKSAEELLKIRYAADAERQLLGDVAESAYRSANRSYFLQKAYRDSVRVGSEFGAYSGLQEGASQLRDRRFDPMSVVEHSIYGFGQGMAFGAVLSPLTPEVGRIAANAERNAQPLIEGAASKRNASPAVVQSLEREEGALLQEKVRIEEKFSKSKDLQSKNAQDRLAKIDQRLADLQTERANVEPRKVEAADSAMNQSIRGEKPVSASTWEASKRQSEKSVEAVDALKKELDSVKGQQLSVGRDLEGAYQMGFDKKADKIIKGLEKRQDALMVQEDLLSQKIAGHSGKYDRAQATLESGTRTLSPSEKLKLEGDLNAQRADYARKVEGEQLKAQIKMSTLDSEIATLNQQRELLKSKAQSPYLSIDAPNSQRAGTVERLRQIEERVRTLNSEKVRVTGEFQKFVNSSRPITAKTTLSQKYETRQSFIDRSYSFAKQQVDSLIESGAVPKEQASAFQEHIFMDLLSKKGLKFEKALSGSTLEGFKLKVELMNRVDKKWGTGFVDTIYKFVRASNRYDHALHQEVQAGLGTIEQLKARGLSPDQITYLSQWVETAPNGLPIFKPEAHRFRDAYAGPIPASEVLARYPELGKLRSEYDRLYYSLPESARESVGYIPGYVHLQSKSGKLLSVNRRSIGNIENPSILEQRSGKWDPDFHETDPSKLFHTYTKQITRKREFAAVLPQIKQDLDILSFSGSKAEFEAYSDVLNTTFGFKNNNALAKDLAQQFSDGVRAQNQKVVFEVLDQLGVNDPAIADEVFTVLKDLQFRALVLNPSNIAKQGLQPAVMAAPEIGASYVARGYKELLTNEGRQLAKQFKYDLQSAEPGMVEEVGLKGLQNKYLKGAQKVIDFTTKPGSALHGALETTNREVVFLGGRKQFLESFEKQGEEGINKVLDGMLDGEKNAVLKAYREGGAEAAAQTYGVIRSYRANFIFSIINRPSMLREGLGRFVPFTSWTSNTFARYVADAKGAFSGNGSQLAKRIAYPMFLSSIFASLTGYTLKGMNPAEDLGRVADFNLFPAVTQPVAEAGRQFRDGAPLSQVATETAKTFGRTAVPYYAQYTQFKRRYGQSYDAGAAAFNAEKKTPQEILVPQILKKLVRGY